MRRPDSVLKSALTTLMLAYCIYRNDNGIPKYTTDLKPRYSDRTNLPGRVGALNPRWNEESNDRILDVSYLPLPYLSLTFGVMLAMTMTIVIVIGSDLS